MKKIRLAEGLEEVTHGVGPAWRQYRLVGATREGLAPAKERVGKNPERYKPVAPGTIFYNPMRILLGSIALLDAGQEPGITSPDYVVFKTRPGLIHPRWFYYWLRSEHGANFIRTLARGAVRERMLFRRLAAAEVEVPAFEVQQRFACAVEPLERARAAVESQLGAANVLFPSYLRAASATMAARSWPRRRLGDLLAQAVKTGISRPFSPTAERRCLTLSAVRDGVLDLGASKSVAVSDAEALGNWVTPGAFYVVRGNGQLRLVGRGALAPAVVDPRVLYPDLLFEVVTDPAQIDRQYLRFIWESDGVRAEIERKARTSAGIFKINQANLAEITLPVPPLEDQRLLARALAERKQKAEMVRMALRTELSEIERLLSSLLRRAFRGEL